MRDEESGLQGEAQSPLVVLRCRQCGWTGEVPGGAIPFYGARVRCGGCGSLLPLIEAPPPADAEILEEPAAPAPRRAPPDEGPTGDARAGEVRALLKTWMRAVIEKEGSLLTEGILWAEHGGELAQLFESWRERHPGPAAARLFRDELFACAAALPGASPLGAARGKPCASPESA